MPGGKGKRKGGLESLCTKKQWRGERGSLSLQQQWCGGGMPWESGGSKTGMKVGGGEEIIGKTRGCAGKSSWKSPPSISCPMWLYVLA